MRALDLDGDNYKNILNIAVPLNLIVNRNKLYEEMYITKNLTLSIDSND